MKNIPIALLNHYGEQSQTLATLLKITRQDGQVFSFNDIDTDIEYGGLVFSAGKGITPSAIASNDNASVDNLNVDGMIVAQGLTEEDVRAGLFDGAKIELWRVNFNDLSAGHEVLRVGFLGELVLKDGFFNAELRGLTQRLQTAVGRIYQPACGADLGDSRCGVNLLALEVNSAVTSVTGASAFIDATRTEGGNYFSNGSIEFLTGENAGFKSEVMAYDGTTKEFFLYNRPLKPFSPGDTYKAHPGCDKSITTCFSKYNNRLNFRGFPKIPGADSLISGESA